MEQSYQKHWPEAWVTGMIKTKNQMGIMTMELSPAAKAFIEFAKKTEKPMLDIGCAFGAATIPALMNGARVIGNDLSEEHLEILKKATPEEYRANLVTTSKSFTEELDFEENSLSAIHISMVLHFLKGEEIMDGLKKFYKWLEPGGKLFIVNQTPYLGLYDWKRLAPHYEERLESGMRWPGEISLRDFATGNWGAQLPEFGHFFDVNISLRMLEEAGFEVEKNDYFIYDKVPEEYKESGKGWVASVAKKPIL